MQDGRTVFVNKDYDEEEEGEEDNEERDDVPVPPAAAVLRVLRAERESRISSGREGGDCGRDKEEAAGEEEEEKEEAWWLPPPELPPEAPRLSVPLLGSLPRLPSSSLSPARFWSSFMQPNRPVVITKVTAKWRACRDWVGERGELDVEFMRRFGRGKVQVHVCRSAGGDAPSTSDTDCRATTFKEYITYWESLHSAVRNRTDTEQQLLYLKDWHFVKEFPSYEAYKTPVYFRDDWLNAYYDERECSHVGDTDGSDVADKDVSASDYRFLYMGPAGSWTGIHTDVLRSFSWSVNVSGTKLWLLLPPSHARTLPPSLHDLRSTHPTHTQHHTQRQHVEWLACVQHAGEAVFVPSGWHHQVINLTDVVSINHNWINACNLHWAWDLLVGDYEDAKRAIIDIKDVAEDFEGLCQRNLQLNSGMHFWDFFHFLRVSTILQLKKIHAEELGTPSPSPNHSRKQLIHVGYNLTRVRAVLLQMCRQDTFAFSAGEEACEGDDDVDCGSLGVVECGLECARAEETCTPRRLETAVARVLARIAERCGCEVQLFVVNNCTGPQG